MRFRRCVLPKTHRQAGRLPFLFVILLPLFFICEASPELPCVSIARRDAFAVLVGVFLSSGLVFCFHGRPHMCLLVAECNVLHLDMHNIQHVVHVFFVVCLAPRCKVFMSKRCAFVYCLQSVAAVAVHFASLLMGIGL